MLELFEQYKIHKPIRLIELFAGYGSQALALKNLGVDFEHHRVVEFDKYAIKSYNALHGTDFETEDITEMQDLNVVEKNKYDYIMTYSFPCQDLSLAGKRGGMGEGTRSGLLWQVERLLEQNDLPQVLIMENVTQVHGVNHKEDFRRWIEFLAKKGYSNQWQDLNAKDYGIPQNRDRTFMVSILGNYEYHFPEPIELKYRLKDYLEKEVDEKYYLSDKMIEGMKRTKFQSYSLENKLQDKEGISNTILSRFEGAPQCIEINKSNHQYIGIGYHPTSKKTEFNGYHDKEFPTLLATDYKAPKIVAFERAPQCVVKAGQFRPQNRNYNQDGEKRKERFETRKDEVSNALLTNANDNMVVEKTLKQELCEGLINSTSVTGGEIINHSYTNSGKNKGSRLEYSDYIETTNGILPTLHTRGDTMGYVEPNELRIRKLTPRECLRLMGLKDSQINKMQAVQSNAQLYKQAGNSIVVDVLQAIFKEML